MTVRLIIELREDGKVYVNGPLDKKDLCLAIIEEAKGAVKNYQKPSIIVPGIKDIKNILK